MNVQGCLTDGAGAPVAPGLKIFTFRIFNMPVGGAEIWPGGAGEQHTLPTDGAGLWNAAVGALIPLTEAVFADSARWLQVTVDDGVLPAETLPRIKLNTIPYTYHARTLEGNSVGDLQDLFVDITGDTATGFITVNKPNKAGVGSSVRVNNVNDGLTVFYPVNNTIGLMSQASSNGTESKFGVIGWADGDNDLKAGVYGEARGSGGVNIGVYGMTALGTADSSYSGYFYGGDLVVLAPRHPGNSAVVLPANSISAGEMLDEPGISRSYVYTHTYYSGDYESLDSVFIDCPSSGYVEVEITIGWVNIAHVNGTKTEIWAGASTTPASIDLNDAAVYRIPLEHASTSDFALPMHSVRFYSVSPGTHKYYLNFRFQSGAGAYANVRSAHFVARFIPTLYGTAAVAAATDNSSISIGQEATGAAAGIDAPPAPRREITKRENDARLETEMEALRSRLRAIEASLSAIRGTDPAREQ
jgi:hypothetical protein